MTKTTETLVARHFTTKEENPYFHIQWDKRDAIIANENGEPVFEQRDVIFPDFWSAQATNIVASKYFRVKNGIRETSVRHMINRAVCVIGEWGQRDNYFANSTERIAFECELTYLLVNQYASFNSPVWFNVGVQEKPQCSACFILDVDDNMESILEWYRTEGMIFKNGSGAGVNVSKIRKKGAPLSNGGKASGPVSFMRGADTNAGVIKSGGGTRRAAKMVIMDVEHPDIHDFIWCKVKAEKMAQDLLNLGYQDGLEGDVQQTIPFQNANNSVSVGDGFMRAVLEYGEKGLNTKILYDIAAAAHQCGDPGLFFRDTVNKWHTTPGRGEIVSSNPCSEFVRPPNEACNLASLNLLRFLNDDGSFDIPGFQQAVRVMITAMDILVDRSSYPTEMIAQNSHDYRSLGLGYANLGALLMAKGLPYDSDEGRNYAGAITALMTGEAYLQSCKIAQVIAPFPGYEYDKQAMKSVTDQHIDAVHSMLNGDAQIEHDLRLALIETWSNVKVKGQLQHGFRNCQTTLLAPTGTISFMMDCDTTGIEPDTALVKNKKLVGGGTMRMVNKTVPRAIKALGYPLTTVNKILVSLENTGSLQDSVRHKLLNNSDIKVFQTALGDNALSWEAHVKMVAAVQPFLSGAVSKTINMPASSTVDDVAQAFIMSWQLGLKSVAVYVDGSKSVQPVTAMKQDHKTPTQEEYNFEKSLLQYKTELINDFFSKSTSAPGTHEPRTRPEGLTTFWECDSCASQPGQPLLCPSCLHNRAAITQLNYAKGDTVDVPLYLQSSTKWRLPNLQDIKPGDVVPLISSPQRNRLPNERPAVNHKFAIGQHEGYLNVGLYPDTGKPGELFIHMAKEGSTVSGLMDTVGILTSILLQYGVPLEVITNKLSHVRFEPSGFTGYEPVPFAHSPIDYVFRWLAHKYGKEQNLTQRLEDVTRDAMSAIAYEEEGKLDAPTCADCGIAMTRRAGSCYICDSCGSSSGCS